jgi:hypothetical protein
MAKIATAMPDDDDFDIIFVRCFRHHKTGRMVYSKDGRPFPLRIRRPKGEEKGGEPRQE